jgi:hypothetical protein
MCRRGRSITTTPRQRLWLINRRALLSIKLEWAIESSAVVIVHDLDCFNCYLTKAIHFIQWTIRSPLYCLLTFSMKRCMPWQHYDGDQRVLIDNTSMVSRCQLRLDKLIISIEITRNLIAGAVSNNTHFFIQMGWDTTNSQWWWQQSSSIPPSWLVQRWNWSVICFGQRKWRTRRHLQIQGGRRVSCDS